MDSLKGLLSLRGDEAGGPDGIEVPPRVLAISVFALLAAAAAALIRPATGADYAGLIWILALIPPFLLSYYRGWTGGLRALAAGMAMLTLTEVVAGQLMEGAIDWWIYGGATTGLIAVSLGSGAMAELFRRTGGGPGIGDPEEVRRREIRRAVEDGQLQLHFQPVVTLEDRRTVGVEALVRWDHPRRGLLEANEFVALAESAGLLTPVGNWAVEEAFRHFALWRRKFSSSPDFFVAINLSTGQCRQPGLVESIRSLLERHDVRGEDLQVEVTEETLDQAGTQLAQLEGLGAAVAVDDVGTGYVSLGQLARLKIDALKVDGSFVARMAEHEEDRATVDAIVRVGKALGLPVTAEAVESEEQYALLKEMGCDLGQGSFFAEPFPASALEARLGSG
jgi:EAL domain-containing protein (putative c-di-GMP-specific phosphodiesterase class I)